MELKTKYVTPEDYKMYFGVDLNARMRMDDNPSDTANAFFLRLENRMASYINAEFYRNVDQEYKTFSNFQKEHYKLALLEQAYYIIRNSEISTDSGYDPDKGIVASNLDNLTIAPNAKRELELCGLWCRHIRNRGRRGLNLNEWLY